MARSDQYSFAAMLKFIELEQKLLNEEKKDRLIKNILNEDTEEEDA